jgi:prepilin-type N-terminal cleavage/methylation domain-containing protein
MTAARTQHSTPERTAPQGARAGAAGLRCSGRGGRGFTLIELLIVIAVIGLLIAVLGLVGSRVLTLQKVRYTEAIMRNVTMAIDQFAAANPLRTLYDVEGIWRTRTFGAYPPYQVKPSGVSYALESRHAITGESPPASLAARLQTDFSGQASNGGNAAWVALRTNDPANDDNRALYAYLRAYNPGVLSQVPADALKPLDARAAAGDPNYAERVNPTGNGTTPDSPGAFDVLGFHDAWGVPLDYFLYVRLEYGMKPAELPVYGFFVTDRRPCLRSRGITREAFDTGLADARRWIFSEPFPAPASAAVDGKTGNVGGGANSSRNGWARAVGAGDWEASDADRTSWFGFVP